MTRFKHFAPGVMICLCALAAFLAVWLRMPYGVELTDEAYWAAEPYLVTQGAVPFATLWVQTPLTALLIAPLVSLYTAITGGTVGIFLFMCRAAVVVRAGIALSVWLLLRNHLGKYTAAGYCMLLFLTDMGHTRPLNYNMLSLYLLALAGAFLFNGMRQQTAERAAARYAAAGVVMAMCAMAHITQLLNCVMFVIVLWLLDRRSYKRLPIAVTYALAGLATAAMVLVGLEIAGGGQVFSGLAIVLREYNYFQIPLTSWSENLERALRLFQRADVLYLGVGLVVLLLLIPAFFILRRRWPVMVRRGAALFIIVALSAIVCLSFALIGPFALRLNANVSDYCVFFFFASIPAWALLIPQDQRRAALELMACFWVPCLVSILAVVSASYSPIDYRFYMLTGGAILLLPISKAALTAVFSGELPARLQKLRWLFPRLGWLPSILLAISLTVTLYSYVYRDDPLSQLTYRVASGVYRGCYTSAARGQAMVALEQKIQEVTGPDEAVLFGDWFSAGYLMTQATPCTPTVASPTLSGYGFKDDDMLMEYFNRVNQTPDKIIFIQTNEVLLTIDDPAHEHGIWVNKHYTLTDTLDGLYPMRAYTRIKT